jgi:hypothetical protein
VLPVNSNEKRRSIFAAFSVSAVSRLLLDCGRDANMDMVRETIVERIRKARVCMYAWKDRDRRRERRKEISQVSSRMRTAPLRFASSLANSNSLPKAIAQRDSLSEIA